MSKSIVIACKYASAPSEGMLTKLYYLGLYLSRQNFDVTLVRGDNHHFSDKIIKTGRVNDNFEIVTLRCPSYSRGSKFRRVYSWITFELKLLFFLKGRSRYEFYLASSPSLFTALTFSLVTMFRKNAKFILDVRDIWPLTLTAEGGMSENSFFIRILKFIERFASKRASCILSSIPNLREYYTNELNINKDHVFFPICVDEEMSVNINTKSKNDGSVLRIGYVGSLGVSNNLDNFFNAIVALEKETKIEFHIFGDGELLNKYKNICQYCDNVKFHGHIERDIVNEVYNLIDIGYVACHESQIWKYGQSLNKVLSYMENGVPILISYPESGYKSMINEAECGWFIPNLGPDDLKTKFLELGKLSGKQISEYGSNGRNWVRENRSYRSHTKRVAEYLISI